MSENIWQEAEISSCASQGCIGTKKVLAACSLNSRAGGGEWSYTLGTFRFTD